MLDRISHIAGITFRIEVHYGILPFQAKSKGISLF